MDAKRLSFIVKTLMVARKRGAILKGKSALEIELNNWFNEPEIILPITNFGLIGESPKIYEIEMGIA